MATMCEHTDRQAYADKMCMYCYQKKQRLRRRLEKNQDPQHLLKPKKRIKKSDQKEPLTVKIDLDSKYSMNDLVPVGKIH